MLVHFCKSKIGHATIRQAELHYEGSITVDQDLLDAVDIFPGEKVDVLNLNNGNRFQTYTIAGTRGSGDICLNGPAARLGLIGDKIMIIAYAMAEEAEARSHKIKVIHLDDANRIKS